MLEVQTICRNFFAKNNDARWHIWQAKWQNEIGALYFCWVLASGWIGSRGSFIIRAVGGRLARGLLNPTSNSLSCFIWKLSELLSACTVSVDCVVLCFAILLMYPIKPIPVEDAEYLNILLANCWAAAPCLVTLVTITPQPREEWEGKSDLGCFSVWGNESPR